MSRRLLVVAGEISGDLHAGSALKRLRELMPELRIWGIGGDELAAAAVDLRHHTRDMAVMGLAEVLRRLTFFRRVLRDTLEEARRDPPDVALLVDYPGFNLRMAAGLKELGVRVVYYISPQVWAWRRSRIQKMARLVDRLLVIFPFDEDLFRQAGIRTEFVGHPLVESARAVLASPDAALPWCGSMRVAVLPGSRKQEIERILPLMAAAAWWMRRKRPECSFLLAAPNEEIALIEKRILLDHGFPDGLLPVVSGQTRDVLKQARAAWVASGTATLDTCLLGCPMVVVYRTSPITYAIARRVVKVPFVGMVNLIAGRKICPECIQSQATPQRLVEALEPLMENSPERDQMVRDLRKTAHRLGDGGAAERVAAILAEELALPSRLT